MNLPEATNQLLIHMKQTGTRPETQRSYSHHQQKFSDYLISKYNVPLQIEDVSLQDVEAYLYDLQVKDEWSVSSVNITISALKKLFAYAERMGWADQNVMTYIDTLKKKQVERHFLTEDEMTRLIAAVDHEVIQLVIRTLAYSGLRISECIHLTLQDIDFEKNIIHVIDGKGGKDRDVPLAEPLANDLMLYRDTKRPQVSSNRFFALKRTGKISDQYVNRELKKAVRKAGIDKEVTAHTLRHSFASALVSNGTDLPTVADLLGHSDYRTVTSIYVHKEQEQLTDAVNQLKI